MSKYSGLFLSFLLIFICLWINICRYPQAWRVANGGGTSSSEKETESVKSDDVLETNLNPYPNGRVIAKTNSAEEGSWPKPVIITSKISSEKEISDRREAPAEGAVPEENSSFQTVSMSSVSEEENKEGTPQELEPSKDGDALTEENGNGEEKNPEEVQEDEEDSSLQVHSSYMAAEFPEGKSPLNSDSPSYEVK